MTKDTYIDRRRFLQSLTAVAGSSSVLALTATELVAKTTEAQLSLSQQAIQQAYLNTPDGQVHYWTAGRGPVLLLIHQSGNSAEEYAGLVPYLAERYRMVAVDLPGHGNSDDPVREPTVEDYTLAARRVIDYLGIKQLSVLGHHGGALVAMNLAAQEPKRFVKTILSGTSGLRDAEESKAFIASLKKVDTSISPDGEVMGKVWDRYVKMMSPGGRIKDIYKPYLANLEARLRPYRAIFVYLRWDRRQVLEKLKGPILLLQGDADNYVSKQEELLKILPNAKRIVMRDCGVFMFYDKPEQCARVIRDYLG